MRLLEYRKAKTLLLANFSVGWLEDARRASNLPRYCLVGAVNLESKLHRVRSDEHRSAPCCLIGRTCHHPGKQDRMIPGQTLEQPPQPSITLCEQRPAEDNAILLSHPVPGLRSRHRTTTSRVGLAVGAHLVTCCY